MLYHDDILFEAGLKYREILGSDKVLSIAEFVAIYPSEYQEELAVYLEDILAFALPLEDHALSDDELIIAEKALKKAWSKTHAMKDTLLIQTLSEIRQGQGLSMGQVAKQAGIPIPVMGKLERGKVDPASVPQKFLDILASILHQGNDIIRRSLVQGSIAGAVQLSAKDGVNIVSETIVSFDEALRTHGVSEEECRSWEI